MAEYTLANGYTLTDEEIEARAQEWESGTWEGQLVEIRAGRPRLSNEPNANLSFKCPQSGAAMIERAAEISGVKKSAFLREAALEKAARIIALATMCPMTKGSVPIARSSPALDVRRDPVGVPSGLRGMFRLAT